MRRIFLFLSISSFQFVHAQDSTRFDFLSKREKSLANNFVAQRIDTFLFLKKHNLAYLSQDSVLVIYKKNGNTYKQLLQDSINFSTPIQIDKGIIDSFFINKIAKLNRKERGIRKERSKWNVQIFPNGTYYDLNYYFEKKQYFAFLGEEYYTGGYHKPEFYLWFDKLKEEMRK
jgi:hypothetical protein